MAQINIKDSTLATLRQEIDCGGRALELYGVAVLAGNWKQAELEAVNGKGHAERAGAAAEFLAFGQYMRTPAESYLQDLHGRAGSLHSACIGLWQAAQPGRGPGATGNAMARARDCQARVYESLERAELEAGARR